MDRRSAKDLLHVRTWLGHAAQIVAHGEAAYLADALLQEAGDSVMMKLGEAAGRLARAGVEAPEGVEWALVVANRNFLVHQYDEIDRDQTWHSLSDDLPAIERRLRERFDAAEAALIGDE